MAHHSPPDPTTPLSTMMSGRIANLLGRNGILTLADLLDHSTSDLTAIPQCGPGTLNEITTILAAHDLTLAPDPQPDFGPTVSQRLQTALDERQQLIALITRIRTASSPEIRDDIDKVLARLNDRP